MATDSETLRRAVLQRLQALRRAGVTHLPIVDPASPASGTLVQSSGAEAETDVPRDEIPPPREAALETAARDEAAEGTEMAKQSDTKAARQAALDELAVQVASCVECNELATTRTQTVFGVGHPKAKLAFVGEAPGRDEDLQGEPFVGRAGKLLTDIVEKGMGLQRSDVYICNILRCRPPGNRNPAPLEAARCRKWLDGTLAIVQPKFICCLGAVAAQNLLDTDESIGKMRGRWFDYNGIRVMCTYHPAYLLRNPSAKGKTWEDIQMLMREMGIEVKG